MSISKCPGCGCVGWDGHKCYYCKITNGEEMIFLSEPTMEVDVLAVMKNDHGYIIALQNGTDHRQIVIEDEDKVLDFVAEIITGRYDAFADKEPEVEILN